MQTTLYQLLGVPSNATKEDIRLAYRKMAKEYHPDTSTDPEAAAKFKTLESAYTILKDDEKRKNYDEWLIMQVDLTQAPIPLKKQEAKMRPRPLGQQEGNRAEKAKRKTFWQRIAENFFHEKYSR